MSIEGLAFFKAGKVSDCSSCSSFSVSGSSGNEVFERVDFLTLGVGARLDLAEALRRVLEGGLTMFSFSSLSGSTVRPRFRLIGRDSIGVSSEALAARDDRRGGIILVFMVINELERDRHIVLHVESRHSTTEIPLIKTQTPNNPA